MKQKLFTLLTLALFFSSGAWAGAMWTLANATYNSTSKGYEIADVGVLYKSTSGGEISSILTDNDATWAAGKKYYKTGSSLFIFSPSQNVTGLKLYMKIDSNRTLSSVQTSNSRNGTYTTLTVTTDYTYSSTSSDDRYILTKDEYDIVTFTFTSTITSGTCVKFTLSGNANVYGVELVEAGDAITLDKNHASATANGSGSIPANATSFTPTAPTYAGHSVDGYYTTSGCATMIATAAGALQPSITVSEVAWTDGDSKWVKGGAATFYAHWKVDAPEVSCTNNLVTITVPSGSSVYYTDDGSTEPTSSSTPYSTPFAITTDKTIKAIAIQDGCTTSDVTTEDCVYATPTYTITYNAGDGSGSMSPTTDITEGNDQALTANAFTRECYSFSHWTADVAVTIGGSSVAAGEAIADGATIQNVTSNITLTAQWSKVYASGSYTFENNATVGTSPSKTVTTSKTTYDAFQVDNLYFSGMTIEYEAGVYGGEGDDFKGWKIKTKDATIKFFVESDKSVIIGVGNLSSGAKISYTNTAGEEKNDIALTAKTNNTYDVKGGTMVTVKTDGASTVTLKKIYITNATSTISATVGKNGYTTFASPYALDLTDANRPDGLKAYKATRDGVNISFTALNQTVAPGTGLLLLGETKDGSYDIKVVASGDAIYGNALIGVTSVTPKQSVADDTYYFVMKKATSPESALEFLPLSTSSAVNIPAGKAYIEVPNSAFDGPAQELSFTFEDESGDVTGIAEVSAKKAFNGEFYNLNGQKVAKPTKGLYIVNGKKVVIR